MRLALDKNYEPHYALEMVKQIRDFIIVVKGLGVSR